MTRFLCLDCDGLVEIEQAYDYVTFSINWQNTGECSDCKRTWTVEEILTDVKNG